MNEIQRILKTIVEDAIRDFNENERYLMENDLSERCICAKFACYLERRLNNTGFSDYKVNVEYNRGMYGKTYASKLIKGHNAVVDLIVHKYGYDELYGFDNLICIEMKKTSRERYLISDKDRLDYLTHGDFNYKIGFMLVIENEELTVNQVFLNDNYF